MLDQIYRGVDCIAPRIEYVPLLNELFLSNTPSDLLKDLFREERKRLQEDQPTLAYALLRSSEKESGLKPEKYKRLILTFLEQFPKDLMAVEARDSRWFWMRKCVHYSFISLVFENALSDLKSFWWKEAAKKLLQEGLKLDSGYINGQPIFNAYLLDEQGFKKCSKLVDFLECPDREGVVNGGALHVALGRSAPEEVLRKLIAKNPDVNKRVKIGFGEAEWVPLEIAIHKANKVAIELLLNNGADPNVFPPTYPNSTLFTHRPILTPFQMAFERGHPAILQVFQNHEGYLSTDLHPLEQDRREEQGHPRGYSSLEINLKAWFKKREMTEGEFEGLKVVYREQDEEALGKALKQLFEKYRSTSYSIIWQPILERFKKRLKQSPQFTLFASSSKVGGFNLDTASEIYLKEGLEQYDYTHVIAHEIAHVYSTVLQEGMGLQFLSEFRKMMDADHLLNKELPYELKVLLDGMKRQYPKEQYNYELFVRVLVQFPIIYAMNHPHLTQDELCKVLEEVMPHTFAHYKEKVIN